MLGDIQEFNAKFGILSNRKPGFLTDTDMKQRLDFQLEELLETADAAGLYLNYDDGLEFRKCSSMMAPEKSLPDILDGIVDQMYVLMGTAVKMGFFAQWDKSTVFEEAWKRVHEANMQKEMVPGMWKIQKPEGWQRPELGDLCK